ncbi:hypothetical protein ABIE69_000425 [Rhodobacteraceae bacterium MBR-64]
MNRSGWAARLHDPAARATLGGRIATLTEEAFQVLRWSVMVGFARYMAISFSGLLYDAVYWFFAGLLFAYLASRFLLSPEIRIFSGQISRTRRLVQTAFNFMVCVLAFVVVLWVLNALVDGFTTLRAQDGVRRTPGVSVAAPAIP